jgi:hypothetical protein
MRQTQKGAGKFKRQKPKVNKSHRRRVKYQNPYSYLADRSSPPSSEMDVPKPINTRQTQDINPDNNIPKRQGTRSRRQTMEGQQYRDQLLQDSRRTATRRQREIAKKQVDELAGMFGNATL